MLVVYIGYIAGCDCFIHEHQFQNRVIVHSHPYTNSHHGHTSQDLRLLDLLQECSSTEAIYFELPVCAEIEHQVLVTVMPQQQHTVNGVLRPQLRAPPVR